MPLRQKRILLALGWYDFRLHRGIAQYASQQGWHLCADVTQEKIIPWGWEGDGILAWLGTGDDLADFVVHARKPTVDFSFRRLHLPFPRVSEDHAGAAALAAEHFLSRGVTRFVFYSDSDNWAYEARGLGFVNALREAGHSCQWLRWHQSTAFTTDREAWKRKRQWLASELKRVPKPAGVFTATDNHALEIMEVCDTIKAAVPDQVAIIGAGNSLLAVESMRIPISSIDTNMERVGYEGAELLDRLMQGAPPPREPIRVPALGLIPRKSSDLLAVAHPGVAHCLRFIWNSYSRPISVADVVEVSGMSRRSLYTAFMEQIGRSPGEELHRVRIAHAKKLLVSGDMKMESLAQMCGYQSSTGFWLAFKQATGQTPKGYRNKLKMEPQPAVLR